MAELSIPQINPLILLPLIIWIYAWKGVALWKAARNSEKKWFVALLILNTLGILPIIYIFFFSRKKISQTNQT